MSATAQPTNVGSSGRRSSGDKKASPGQAPNVITRNGARQAKIQTRAMATGRKPVTASAALLAHKKKAMQKKKMSGDTVLRDHYQNALEAKNMVRGATGLTSDPRMIEHRCLWDPNYPECPERLSSVIKRCEELGLISQCKPVSSRAASEEEVNTLHSPSVHELMKNTHASESIEQLEDISSKYDAVYIHPSSHELSLLAVGSTIDLVEAVVQGEIQNGVAFIRPPGHHAMKAEPCGYCFYNNVALAAKHAIDKLGVDRILIVDWDVHHGQATQQMFYDDPRVVYFSIHRYEHGAFWPNLRHSNFNYIGNGAGKGYNFNVPLNKTGMKDADYLAIWHQLLLPMALEYKPQLVLVSAGYDAAVGCPEGEMEITPACYAHLTHMLMGVCSRICVVLEGGYCLQSLAEGAALTLRTLLGYAPPSMQKLTVACDSVRETILNCIYAHKPYWRCYSYQATYSVDTSTPNVCDEKKEKHIVQVLWEGDETRQDRFETRNCYPVQSQEFLYRVKSRLDHLQIVTDLSIPAHPVCYIYDEAMLKHKNIVETDHVECPERILRVHERHRDYNLLARLHHLTPRQATDEEILLVHSEGHLARLKELSKTKLRDLNQLKEKYDSVYFHPESLHSARVAAGCVLQMVESVLSGGGGCGVCVVRPPGHHADDDTPSGFCLLNNAAVAARYATRCHGLKRVLLLDWDVHHGNGTQKIFESDPSVLYLSLHNYLDGSFFPYSKNADYTFVGIGGGEGYNVNIPWNKRGMGDVEYLAAFMNVVLPIAYEFDPELVIVSAGFDACIGDPLGGCKVSPECYGRLTHWLRGLARGRVVLCLEGGYNTTSTSYAMTMCTKALLGDPIPHFFEPKQICHWSSVESINNVIMQHSKYWKSLKFQLALPVEDVLGEPAPSRGLDIEDHKNAPKEPIRPNTCFNASTSTLNDTEKCEESTNKSLSSLNESLEDSLGNVRISNASMNSSMNRAMDNLNVGSFSIDSSRIARSDCKTVDKTYVSPRNDYFAKKEPKTPLNTSGANFVSVRRTPESSSPTASNISITSDKRVTRNSSPNTSLASITPEKRVTRNSSKSQSPPQTVGEEHPKCTDGNCGTDDEDEKPGSSKADKPGCSKPADSKVVLLVDYLADNMEAIANEEMFAVIPQSWCPHLESLIRIPESVRFEQGEKCVDCNHGMENWVCLHCYVVACARGINGHMQAHYNRTQHPLVLSLVDLSVWCNECDSYVDNSLLYYAKNLAHQSKFGEPMAWCYGTDTKYVD